MHLTELVFMSINSAHVPINGKNLSIFDSTIGKSLVNHTVYCISSCDMALGV